MNKPRNNGNYALATIMSVEGVNLVCAAFVKVERSNRVCCLGRHIHRKLRKKSPVFQRKTRVMLFFLLCTT